MSDSVAIAARASARRLASELGPGLRSQVELALLSRAPARRPDQYPDIVEIGGLIVSIASFAWTVYRDRRGKDRTPTKDDLAETIRRESGEPLATSSDLHDKIIDVVAEETIAAAEREAFRDDSSPPAS
jgi:hypothetical protein